MGQFSDPGLDSPEWRSLTSRPAAASSVVASVVADLVEDKSLHEVQGDAVSLLTGVVQTGFSARGETLPLLAAYSAIPNLRQTVGRISEMVASVPWRMFVSSRRPVARSIARQLSSWRVETKDDFKARDAVVKQGLETGDLRELDDHPALTLLFKQPNPDHTALGVRQVGQISRDLVGESFEWAPRDGGPVPNALWPIPSHWIRSTPSVEDPFFSVSWKTFHREIPEEEMIWMRHLDPVNPYQRGTGIGRSLADELDGDEWASKHIANFFRNGATPDNVVMIPDTDELQLKVIRLDWELQNRGIHRSRRTHFLNAEAKIKELQASFREMDTVALRKFYGEKVRQTYGVPPEIFGIVENSNRATIASAGFIIGAFVILPRLRFLKAEYDMRVLPLFPESERLVLIHDDPVPEDREARLDAMKGNPASASLDEWREFQGLQPVGEEGGGALHTIQRGTVLLPLDPEGVNLAPETGGSAHEEPEENRRAPRGVSKAPTAVDIERLIEILEPIPLQVHSDPVMEDLVRDFGQATLTELGSSLSFGALDPLVVDHLAAQSVTRLAGLVHESTKAALRTELIAGVLEGEGIPALALRVRSVFGAAGEQRATTIARTEVLRASNFGRWQGMAQSGLVAVRKWITAGDPRVRQPPRDNANHVVMNGQKAAINRPFVMPAGAPFGGRTAMHPGDFGVAALDINCRCTTIPVIPGGKGIPEAFTKDASPEHVKAAGDAVARRMMRWEVKLEGALRVAFGEQRRRMIDLLRELSRL